MTRPGRRNRRLASPTISGVHAIPGGPSRTSIATVARIPGTSEALAGGFTHAAGNAGLDDAGVLLEYES